MEFSRSDPARHAEGYVRIDAPKWGICSQLMDIEAASAEKCTYVRKGSSCFVVVQGDFQRVHVRWGLSQG